MDRRYPQQGQIHSNASYPVCSRHFKTEDIREPASETGRRLLKKGAVPQNQQQLQITQSTSFTFQARGSLV